jgi:hypothetical protein
MKFIFGNSDEFRPKTNCIDHKTGRRHELEIAGIPGAWTIETDAEILAADLAMNRPWTMLHPERYAFPLIQNDLGLTNRRQCIFIAGRKTPLAWDRWTDKIEDVDPVVVEPEAPVAPPAPPEPPPAPEAPEAVVVEPEAPVEQPVEPDPFPPAEAEAPVLSVSQKLAARAKSGTKGGR